MSTIKEQMEVGQVWLAGVNREYSYRIEWMGWESFAFTMDDGRENWMHYKSVDHWTLKEIEAACPEQTSVATASKGGGE